MSYLSYHINGFQLLLWHSPTDWLLPHTVVLVLQKCSVFVNSFYFGDSGMSEWKFVHALWMRLSKRWSSGNEWIVSQACTQRTEHSCLTGLVWFKRRTRLVSSFTLRSSYFNWESIDFLQSTERFDFVCLIKGNQNFNKSYLPTFCCLPQHPSAFNGCFSHMYFSSHHLWVSHWAKSILNQVSPIWSCLSVHTWPTHSS